MKYVQGIAGVMAGVGLWELFSKICQYYGFADAPWAKFAAATGAILVALTGYQHVQVRIDGAVREEATAVLAAMGLTISDAVRSLLTRVAHEKALPFAPLVPNEVTI